VLSKKAFLEKWVKQYNHVSFIHNDPICIPHRFNQHQNIEIAGFFAAIFAWGNRNTIINKCSDLIARMDNNPYQFIMQANDIEYKKLIGFKHRTFNDTDLLYTLAFFKKWYSQNNSLEEAFAKGLKKSDVNTEQALNYFRTIFFSLAHIPPRTHKHIASPVQKSACKRINMFLRWMVRKDKNGVDFGIWKKIKPAQLICPLDLHVQRTATQLGLLHRTQADWKAAIELTNSLKIFDANDPVKYDFALFGLGISKKL
jgi:uncharacterized protein (TIGR02757 family)